MPIQLPLWNFHSYYYVTFTFTRKNCDVCTVGAGFREARLGSGPTPSFGGWTDAITVLLLPENDTGFMLSDKF